MRPLRLSQRKVTSAAKSGVGVMGWCSSPFSFSAVTACVKWAGTHSAVITCAGFLLSQLQYSNVHIRVTLYWGYLIVLRLFYLVCISYCGCFNLFCNMWVCVCVGVCLYGFCNMSVCVCVGVCLYGFCNMWVCVCVGVCLYGFCNKR
jgi:hypothetical protein